MTRAAEPRPEDPRFPRIPRAGDPYGLGPVGSYVAPLLSIIGLVLVGIVTLSLLNGQVPFIGRGSGDSNGPNAGVGSDRTPAPSNVVIVDPEASFKGSIVYAKAGNIWIQTSDGATQLTSSGDDSMPAWSPDGRWVYFVRSTTQGMDWSYKGAPVSHYWVDVPDLMRVAPDNGARPERLATGKFKKGRYTWSYWLRDPAVSPDGSTVALVSDAPNPETSDVVLQFLDVGSGKLTRAGVADAGLGHQDPAWRADGRYLLYVRNGRDGARGAQVIVRLDLTTDKIRVMTAAGYNSPAYSPNGRWIAATRTTSLGTDVVILDGSTGRELQRITTDGSSFDPTWSPAGDGIAFLHLVGQTVDLRLAQLDPKASTPTVTTTLDLTEVSGLDANSKPDWYIPADQLPAPPPTPSPSVSPGNGASSAVPSRATP